MVLWLQEVESQVLRKVWTARDLFSPRIILINSSSFLQLDFEAAWCHFLTSRVLWWQTACQPQAFAIPGAPSHCPFGPHSVSYLSLPVMNHSPTIIALVCWADLSNLQNNSFIFEIGLEINTYSATTDMKITTALSLFYDECIENKCTVSLCNQINSPAY